MTIHTPVLLQEIIESLNLKVGDIVFDGTLGGGGYAQEILKKIGTKGILLATDLDAKAIDDFSEGSTSLKIFNRNYSEIKNILREEKIDRVNGIVLDLGISSDQLSDSRKGISFQKLNDPLDMNLSDKLENRLTATKILNTWDETNLADIIFYYGGEKAARKIARAIVQRRKVKEFKKVADLVQLLEEEIGKFYWNKKINCATKTFQALRITVNDEIGHLKKVLEDGVQLLAEEGHLVVVTFHSLEDRVVKNKFREFENQGFGERVNKKVIKPTKEELSINPRARSAKLRIFKKYEKNKNDNK